MNTIRTKTNGAETLKSLRPVVTRSELLERVSAVSELPSLSPIVSQVLKITAGEKYSMEELARVVGQDYGLSLKILRLANSSVYSRGYPVDTVHKAVGRIGANSIRQVALSIGVIEHFASMAFRHQLNTPQFWEHSMACGVIAAELAHALNHGDPERAFTAGLLHDLGRIICAEALGEHYVQVLETAEATGLPLEQVEARMMMLSHAEVMGTILGQWTFPTNLVNPIVFHHAAPVNLKAMRGQAAAEILRLGLADRLAHAMILGSSGNDMIYPIEEHCRQLGVSPPMVARVEETARQHTSELVATLVSNSGGAKVPRRSDHYCASLRAPFRPLYLSAAPGIDACRILCDTLAGSASDLAPNVAIVHLTGDDNPAELARALEASEASAGLLGLPALVLSPGDRCMLNRKAWGARRQREVPTPIPMSRFVAAVNDLLAAVPGARRREQARRKTAPAGAGPGL